MKYENRMALKSNFVQLAAMLLMAACLLGMHQRQDETEKNLAEVLKVSRAYQASVSECAKERKEWECRAMLGGSAIFMVPSLNLTELK